MVRSAILIAVFYSCFVFLPASQAEDRHKGVLTADEIVERLGRPEIQTMGPGSEVKITFRTDKRAGTGNRQEGAIPFDFDSHQIRDDAKPQLDELGKALSSGLSEFVFEIAGHADVRGTVAYNLDLSLKRARAIKIYLIKHFHISSGRLRAKGYGKSRLVAQGYDEASHALNRRVEIVRLGTVDGLAGEEEPVESRPLSPLTIEFPYFDLETGRTLQISPSGKSVLRTGLNPYQIHFRAPQGCYVYILQHGSNGSWHTLFPRGDSISMTNPVKSGTEYWLPGVQKGYGLDENKGTETIYMLSSRGEIPELEAARSKSELCYLEIPVGQNEPATMGLSHIGKPNPPSDQTMRVDFKAILDRAKRSGGLLKTISFIHE